MSNRCVYCKKDIVDERAIDVCDSCGLGVWGKKMFDTIKQNMANAKEKDDLCSTNTIGIGKLERL